VFDERKKIRALVRREIDFTDAKEKDRVEVVQIANVELFAGRDTGAGSEDDVTFRDELRVCPDERVVVAGLPPQLFNRGERVRNRVVLKTVSNVRPREDVLPRSRLRRQHGDADDK